MAEGEVCPGFRGGGSPQATMQNGGDVFLAAQKLNKNNILTRLIESETLKV